jgi:hypothetical protein
MRMLAPDFVARVWLGDVYVAGNTFAGLRCTVTHRDHSSRCSYVVDMGATQNPAILLQKDGDDGRLYYRLGIATMPPPISTS